MLTRRKVFAAITGAVAAAPEVGKQVGRGVGGFLLGGGSEGAQACNTSDTARQLSDGKGAYDHNQYMRDSCTEVQGRLTRLKSAGFDEAEKASMMRYTEVRTISPSIDCLRSVRDTHKVRMQEAAFLKRARQAQIADLERELKSLMDNLGPLGRIAKGVLNAVERS